MEDPAKLSPSKDLFAAIDILSRSDDPIKTARSFAELAGAFYWKEKNLSAFVLAAISGTTYAVTKARELAADDPDSKELLGLAKAMSYDLGSFTWPGWDEPGIVIDPTSLQIGRQAAKANLRLAQELQRGDLPLSGAHWLIGAHDLAAGDWPEARAAFVRAEHYARAADQTAVALLNSAYALLAEALEDPTDEVKLAAVTEAHEKLAETEDGKAFQDQVLAATRVFLERQRLSSA